jgi:hypothetical protein
MPVRVASGGIGTASWTSNDGSKKKLTKTQDWIENSMTFNIAVVSLIGLNACFIGVEQSYRNQSGTDSGQGASDKFSDGWSIIELTFVVIFTIECMAKLVIFRCAYFFSFWNLFDFVLVTVGIVGMVIEALVSGDTGSEEARLLRMNRVFRVLRIVRVFRLAKFVKILKAKLAKKDVHLELAEYLQVITVLRAFVWAHTCAQGKLLSFVGSESGNLQQVEEARTIVESQIQVYCAITLAAQQGRKCDAETLKELNTMRESTRAMLELSKFVITATKAGIINSREAECVIFPLQGRIQEYTANFHATKEGHQLRSKPSGFFEGSGTPSELLSKANSEQSDGIGDLRQQPQDVSGELSAENQTTDKAGRSSPGSHQSSLNDTLNSKSSADNAARFESTNSNNSGTLGHRAKGEVSLGPKALAQCMPKGGKHGQIGSEFLVARKDHVSNSACNSQTLGRTSDRSQNGVKSSSFTKVVPVTSDTPSNSETAKKAAMILSADIERVESLK